MSEQQRSPAVVLGCSYAAATASLLITFPFDTIKTRLQTSNDSFGRCITRIIRTDGLKGFYRGASAALVSSPPARALFMSVYASLVPVYANLFNIQSSSPNDRPLSAVFMAGLTAGAFPCIFTGPFEFTKTASQVDSLVRSPSPGAPGPTSTTFQTALNVRRLGGWSTLYGGVEYHCMRDSVGAAIYFSVYESLKSGLSDPNSEKPNGFAVVVAGGACGAASWLAVHPIDTMKSAYQRDLYSRTLTSSLNGMVKRPKFKLSLRMYRGLGLSLLRTSLNGVFLFTFFEYFMYITK